MADKVEASNSSALIRVKAAYLYKPSSIKELLFTPEPHIGSAAMGTFSQQMKIIGVSQNEHFNSVLGRYAKCSHRLQHFLLVVPGHLMLYLLGNKRWDINSVMLDQVIPAIKLPS